MHTSIVLLALCASAQAFPETFVVLKDSQGKPYAAEKVKISVHNANVSYTMTAVKPGAWKSNQIDPKSGRVDIDIFRPKKNNVSQGAFPRDNVAYEQLIELTLTAEEIAPHDIARATNRIPTYYTQPCPPQISYGAMQPPFPGFVEVPNAYSGFEWPQTYQASPQNGCGPFGQ